MVFEKRGCKVTYNAWVKVSFVVTCYHYMNIVFVYPLIKTGHSLGVKCQGSTVIDTVNFHTLTTYQEQAVHHAVKNASSFGKVKLESDT